MIVAGIVVASNRSFRGERPDDSGPAAADGVRAMGGEVRFQIVVPDDIDAIADAIREAIAQGCTLVLTSGGTGLSPTDVTPEATRLVIQREAPGIAEAMRARSLEQTPHGMLSRGIAGAVGRTLVVNLPGSPRAVRESLDVLAPAIPHALE
ncbi:MAG TPA: MogA/MoaB family molybdenum cofactor biosynthesis protein, partial [Candidatus Limnocylindria bacterium]|nr:MogA/MoaB family molybdenum cofactor biosynthesis protein [Candidatus Limnocylindria bacterium]